MQNQKLMRRTNSKAQSTPLALEIQALYATHALRFYGTVVLVLLVVLILVFIDRSKQSSWIKLSLCFTLLLAGATMTSAYFWARCLPVLNVLFQLVFPYLILLIDQQIVRPSYVSVGLFEVGYALFSVQSSYSPGIDQSKGSFLLKLVLLGSNILFMSYHHISCLSVLVMAACFAQHWSLHRSLYLIHEKFDSGHSLLDIKNRLFDACLVNATNPQFFAHSKQKPVKLQLDAASGFFNDLPNNGEENQLETFCKMVYMGQCVGGSQNNLDNAFTKLNSQVSINRAPSSQAEGNSSLFKLILEIIKKQGARDSLTQLVGRQSAKKPGQLQSANLQAASERKAQTDHQLLVKGTTSEKTLKLPKKHSDEGNKRTDALHLEDARPGAINDPPPLLQGEHIDLNLQPVQEADDIVTLSQPGYLLQQNKKQKVNVKIHTFRVKESTYVYVNIEQEKGSLNRKQLRILNVEKKLMEVHLTAQIGAIQGLQLQLMLGYQAQEIAQQTQVALNSQLLK